MNTKEPQLWQPDFAMFPKQQNQQSYKCSFLKVGNLVSPNFGVSQKKYSEINRFGGKPIKAKRSTNIHSFSHWRSEFMYALIGLTELLHKASVIKPNKYLGDWSKSSAHGWMN